MHDVWARHALLFRFFFRDGQALLTAIANAWESAQRTDAGKKYSFERGVIDGYNSRYRELKTHLQALDPDPAKFKTRLLVPLLLIRVACVVTAAFASALMTLMVGLLQLMVAPYRQPSRVRSDGLPQSGV